ncbi:MULTISPECIES: glucose 1-dehydrogenase [Micromonospora]|uniref:Glucose 1-dehydrogenase n=1 Tax=Micromonospora profundi TaxID=1420889 RepID=A0AAJ6HV35_9ACTN|nr:MULTISPECIES: glucose 1-dehydrogenase [Micromonospora]KOX07391.1 3-alpha-hydroxysteroid dehydrogenase [Micromonospora sp. NRRL B-16802]NJC13967.1 3alpha(or 20beta)-hydroxysteroid dehydrogenase [Micromonospora profundi]WLS45558.1 glucose 1-dehydrogenase [Micromonospora profundi]
MGRVAGKTAVVTGGAMGMGAAAVRRLVGEGANVVIADVNVAEAEALAAELGPTAVVEKLDVRSPQQWTDLVQRTEERFGSVDILVNNAGIVDPAPLEQWDVAQLQRVLDVNLIGVFNGIQAVTPAMKRAGGGSIVNMGSVAAFIGIIQMAGYVASKWAVRGLTKNAALELGAYGIRVNAVHPGQINTPMTKGATFETSSVALGRVGEPDDVARTVLFLASDDAQFVTGSDLVADGGQIAGQADYSGVPR